MLYNNLRKKMKAYIELGNAKKHIALSTIKAPVKSDLLGESKEIWEQ